MQYLRESFGQKMNLTEYFSGKTRSLLHSNKAQRSFFRLQSSARKIGSKSARKRERVYRIVLMPPGHPVKSH